MALMSGSTSGEALPEVEADEKEILEMELAQLERVRADLQTSSKLSDAEKNRLSDVDSQIAEVRSLLSKRS
jgi:flagellar biosynthesis/type III secretory pathway chaperone